MRIGIIRACGLGDAVQITPLLQQIRADKPGASIEMFINENAASVLEGCPWVDRLHVLPERVMSGENSGLLNWRVWRHVRRSGSFDMLLHLDLQWRRAALLRFMPAAIRASFVTAGRKLWSPGNRTMAVPVSYAENSRHTSQWYLDLWCAASGAKDRGFGYDVRFLLGDARVVVQRPQRVALVPGASNTNPLGAVKRWPTEHWRTLATRFIDKGWTPVFVGTTSDFPANEIPHGAENKLLQAGRGTVREAARIMAGCAGLIGNDTGLYQMAMGLGVASIGLFGATSSKRTGPYRNDKAIALSGAVPCAPCYQSVCHRDADFHPGLERPFCMASVTPDKVFLAAHDLFSNKSTLVTDVLAAASQLQM